MTGFLINPYRFAAPDNEFASMYESFNPLTTVNKQHFVEWFSGTALDSIWTQTNIVGTGTFAMKDAVNGGLSISSGTNVNDNSEIDFNNKRQYAHDGSIIIWVSKKFFTGGSDGIEMNGFTGNITATQTDIAELENSSGGAELSALRTADASTSSITNSDVGGDTSFHSYKIECGSANIKLTIDGVLKVTKTTNRPTIPMQPFFSVLNSSVTGADEINVRYCEAYNT